MVHEDSGEVTAKVIAAGGGHPFITYNVGKDDAESVVAQVKGYGARCDAFQYDVRLPASPQLAQLPIGSWYLYYYATTPIFRRKTKDFDPALFDEFLDYYVRGFYEICTALASTSQHQISAFYPSSISVYDRPSDMTEYAMAKASGEILCFDLSRTSEFRIVSHRLPRLLTDQTATVTPVEMPDSVDVLLPLIRRVQAKTA